MARITTDQIKLMHQILEQHGAKYTNNVVAWGSWDRGAIPAVQEALKVKSRQTVYNHIKTFPQKPEREKRLNVIPQKIMIFEQTEGWKILEKDLIERGQRHALGKHKLTLIRAWELFDRQDPLTFSIEQFKKLRYSHIINDKPNPLRDIKDIRFKEASNLRNAARAWARPDTQQIINIFYKVSKGKPGQRKEWYLEPPDLFKLFGAINELDTLVYARVNLECGARPIALAGKNYSNGKPMPIENQFTPSKINRDKSLIYRVETKKETDAKAKFQPESLDFIEHYIKDMGIGPNEPVFPQTQITYSNRISAAAKRAGIPLEEKEGFGAYVFRHTFATQALAHNISIDGVMESGGWTGSEIITSYYAGVKEEKLDAEFLDKKIEKAQTWRAWILQFDQVFRDRYRALMDKALERGVKAQVRAKTAQKPINWAAAEKAVIASKTPENFRRAWKKALELHRKGLTDLQVKKEMGWA